MGGSWCGSGGGGQGQDLTIQSGRYQNFPAFLAGIKPCDVIVHDVYQNSIGLPTFRLQLNKNRFFFFIWIMF
jgi:hypothetical protein